MKIPIKFYNTLGRRKEIFKPIKKDEVGIYTCGPTVYWYQHIGNLKAYIFSDLLKRTLIYNGYKVKHVINVTDVGHLTSDRDTGEDKIEKAAIKEGKSAKEITEFYFSLFKEDFEKLNIIMPDVWSKATEHIKEQIELIKRLEEKGYTYRTSDGIYFDSSKFKDYGKLANLNIKGLKGGKRVMMGEKKHKTDFALWKFSLDAKRQQEWRSPWGVGFPGWHIECSAMSMKYLGEHFDIHTGGEDHIPIHHTNEIAQSEAATGKKFVNYWLHESFLMNKGEKISKSKGGLYTIPELEKMGYSPIYFRYLNLLTHYKKPLNFTLENLDAAKSSYDKIKRKIIELKKIYQKGNDFTKQYEIQFRKAINDNLNFPRAVQIFIRALNDLDFDSKNKLLLLKKFDSVFGLGINEMQEKLVVLPEKVEILVAERERLRKEKMWAEADIVRQRIKESGYLIEDGADGPKLKKI